MHRTSIAPASRFLFRDARADLPARIARFADELNHRLRAGARFAAALGPAFAADRSAEALFECGSTAELERFGLRRDLLLPEVDPLPVEFAAWNDDGAGRIRVTLDEADDLARIGALLERCAAGTGSEDDDDAELVAALAEIGCLAPAAPLPAPRPAGPGIDRLQHASLLFRGRRSAVLLDPVQYSPLARRSRGGGSGPRDLPRDVDAILITHAHPDHFDLPTLATFPRDLPIVVPHVPRPSLLAEDMAGRLRALGFRRVLSPRWYDRPLVIGDELHISVLPFYGEQPRLHRRWRDPQLRNWGNTYLVECADYSAWALADAGDDPEGRMAEVAAQVARRVGRLDHCISAVREFLIDDWSYVTGGHYWLSLDGRSIAEFPRLVGERLTLGPRGLAEVCAVTGARQVLPYAHWWGAWGEPAADEPALLAELADALARCDSATAVLPWRIGDSLGAVGRGGWRSQARVA
jgi:hypothetical protein